jgi:peptidoglycan-associated lipoprotein
MKILVNLVLALSLAGLCSLAQGSRTSGAELKATLFAPGVISTLAHEGSFAFTPDGRTIYFTRFAPGMTAPKFFVSHLVEGHWSEPTQALMPQGVAASPLCISPDGQRLYFTHERDASGRARLWTAMIEAFD